MGNRGSRWKQKSMIVYAICDGRNRWLEYAKASPPRTPLAGPSTFQQAFARRRLLSFVPQGRPEH
jgi:hypothetical protein